jgi:hypothetical protein
MSGLQPERYAGKESDERLGSRFMAVLASTAPDENLSKTFSGFEG